MEIQIEKRGYNNKVVKIVSDNRIYYLKRYKNKNSLYREIFAIEKLVENSIICPELICKDENFALFLDSGQNLELKYLADALNKLANLLAIIHKTRATKIFNINDLDFDAQPNLVLSQLLKGKKYYPYFLCMVHGDLTTDNILINSEGELVLIDWEESTLSDPLIDLSFAIIDFILLNYEGSSRDKLIKDFEDEYFQSINIKALSELYYKNSNRDLILFYALKILYSWALENDYSELAEKYFSLLE